MHALTGDFIKAKGINSFQKLRFLLFLHRHPNLRGTSEEFAEKLHFGDKFFIEKIIVEFKEAGLLNDVDNSYMLNNDPTIKTRLEQLAIDFDNPLSRQNLLDQVRYGTVSNGRPSHGYYSSRQPATSF